VGERKRYPSDLIDERGGDRPAPAGVQGSTSLGVRSSGSLRATGDRERDLLPEPDRLSVGVPAARSAAEVGHVLLLRAVALGPRTQSAIAASVLRGPPPCDQARGNGASLDVTMRHAEVAGESVVQELSDLPHVGAARQPHEERSDHAVRGTELRLSSTNHNSQKRAAKWSTVIPDLDDPAHWDWPLVTRVCSSTAVATGDGARRHLSPAQVTPLSPAASEVGVSAEYVLVVAVVFVGASAARQRSHWAGWRVDTAATHVR